MYSYVTYKGVKVRYLVFGEGETTLFLHGWEGSIESLLFVANEVGGKKVLIDLPPFGKSSSLQKVWDLFDYYNLVVYIITLLNENKVNVVAHSFGGRIALLLAYNGKINKMVLTGCAGIKYRSFSTKCKIFNFKTRKFLSKLKLYDKNKLVHYGSSDYVKLNDVMKQTFNNIVNCDLRYTLKHIKSKTLLLWGEKDDATPLKVAHILNRGIRGSGLYVFAGGSHFAYLEYKRAFIDSIKIFLNI